MSKRKAPELTGGTGDVNPQWFGFVVLQSAADVFTEAQVPVPINPSMGARANRAIIIEILRVQFIWSLDTTQSPASPQRHTAYLRTALASGGASNSAIQIDPQTVATDQWITIQAGAGATVVGKDASVIQDLTDGAGHGLVIASQNLVLGISTINTLIANRVTVRILYRYKEVGLTEFITLAQFQS